MSTDAETSVNEFILKTNPFSLLRHYLEKFTTMEEAWEECTIGDWLLWCLAKLEVSGLVEYAQWCIEQYPKHSPVYPGVFDLLSQAEALETRDKPTTSLYVLHIACYTDQVRNVAEIKRRWGNPFRKEN